MCAAAHSYNAAAILRPICRRFSTEPEPTRSGPNQGSGRFGYYFGYLTIRVRVVNRVPGTRIPINIPTSVCSKVMEHIVHSQVSRFLDDHHILSPNQHGFRPGRSCETQLISALHDWSSWLDRGIPIDFAIFDFCKRSTRFCTKSYYTSLTITAFVATY